MHPITVSGEAFGHVKFGQIFVKQTDLDPEIKIHHQSIQEDDLQLSCVLSNKHVVHYGNLSKVRKEQQITPEKKQNGTFWTISSANKCLERLN